MLIKTARRLWCSLIREKVQFEKDTNVSLIQLGSPFINNTFDRIIRLQCVMVLVEIIGGGLHEIKAVERH